ncbi:DUF262 domain-containing protein [Pasteurella multocida]|uniref:DUF262 domain-containing protein n=1 Tax=Pasteurella multocida TaxID=747 RepID=UPI00233FFCBE|nr:DUF262 domain-containing HNH endonuclease family protein [Pasteurella multocida]MDC4237507.1 DUF262 domain-containing HNH endonuclease family protein [Pasteurella multocida]HDR1107056.1 DUF262 domain-containing protein [Pasteurella multocida]
MEETMFYPETLNIKRIFSDSDTFYQMPIYQRPYSWDKERVYQLWYDILEAYKNYEKNPNVDQNYFLGSLVVIKKDKSFEVVDGQQRLTTLTILFCVLRDMKLDLSSKNNVVIKKCIHDDEDEVQNARLKLTTHLDNHSLFKTTIIDGISLDNESKSEENRFLKTAFYFKRLIEKANDSSSEDYIPNFQSMIDYIFERVLLIRIKCYDEGFAIKLFSVLNDRGLDLNPTDIIKAYLLQKLSCETDRKSFIEVWKRIENLCKQSKESMQNLFNLYLFYSTGENPKNSLQEEYKIKLKDAEPHSLILDIETFAKNLVYIVSDNFDSDISLLKYLPNKLYWRAILAAAKQVNYHDFDLLKNLIMRYFYQSWIAEGTSSRIKQTSFNIIKEVKKNSTIVDIKNLISKNLEKYESYQSFLPRQNIYNKSWHKPVLFLLEYNTQEKMSFVEISDDIHTEHILPKGWENDNLNWSQCFTKDDANEFIDSLGNLTLLSGIRNIQASNRNYISKIEIYNGNDGKGIDGKTRFNITQDIMKKYPKHWSIDIIRERRDDMISKIISYLII